MQTWRPRTGISRSMRVKIEDNYPLQRGKKSAVFRIRRKGSQLESEAPEDIYSLIDDFETQLKLPGKSYEYPRSKFVRSQDITTSEGYRTTIFIHKNRERFMKYHAENSTGFIRRPNHTHCRNKTAMLFKGLGIYD